MKVRLFPLVYFLCLGCCSVWLHAQTSDSFSAITNMSVARNLPTATTLVDGTVLITGGEDTPGHQLSSAEIYDPHLQSFIITGSMSIARSHHTATLLKNGKVLIAGGAFGPAEIYDPSTRNFSPTGTPLAAFRIFGTAATLLKDGRVLFIGGQGSAGIGRPPAEIYDPLSGTFSLPKGSMVQPRFGSASAVLLNNGKVLIVGGMDIATFQLMSEAELYDPITDTFLPTGAMSDARFAATATLLNNGKVLVTGGGPLTSELYDPNGGTFSQTAQSPIVRVHHTATLLVDGDVLLAGGDTGADIYDPTLGTFSGVIPMVKTRGNHAAALLPDGRVLVVGGQEFVTNNFLASAEIFQHIPTCIPDKKVSIDFGDGCGPLPWLTPWSREFGDGTKFEVSCSVAFNTGRLPFPAYMAWFIDSRGNRSRIAQCLFKDGANDGTYTVGHVSGNPAQSCLASVDWHNVDGGSNDGPRQATDFLGNPIILTTNIEPYIDAVDYQFNANKRKLSWKDEKFQYPDATQFADQLAVGDILSGRGKLVAGLTFSVDPLIGPELDNAFDTAWVEMQSDPGGPMRFISGCDLNGDGVCDSSDQALLTAAIGQCAGQAGYIPRIDYDGDGCIGVNDAAVIQNSISAYRAGCVRSQGYWKNHPASWPITSLNIGGNQYTQNELLNVLRSSVSDNGAINLAHQLIAAKLNIASGASPVAAPIASADALINSTLGRLPPLGTATLSPSSVGGYVDTLSRFNEGALGPPGCGNK